MLSVVDEETSDLFKLLPSNNVKLGYLLNESLLDRCIDYKFDKNSNFYKLYKSGSRFSKQQLARTSINIGYFADENNIVQQTPITSNLMTGLTEKEFFQSSFGTRKGIADKSNNTPDSGYLERTLTMALGVIEIAEEDCGDDKGLEIIVLNEKHADTLIGKYMFIGDEWILIDEYNKANKYIGETIRIRSPITCRTKDFKICKKCFGDKKINSKYVGVIAGQVLSERTTQLTLRAFHDSGSARLDIDLNLITYVKKNLVNIKYNNTLIELHFEKLIHPYVVEQLKELPGFVDIKNNIAIFKPNKEEVTNIDVVAVLKDLNNLLNTRRDLDELPVDFYHKFVQAILSVGSPYSSYIEMLFCNSFVCDKEKQVYWRYNQDLKPIYKFGVKSLGKHISPLLGLLYEPNQQSINNIKESNNDIFDNLSEINMASKSIYERLYLGHFE